MHTKWSLVFFIVLVVLSACSPSAAAIEQPTATVIAPATQTSAPTATPTATVPPSPPPIPPTPTPEFVQYYTEEFEKDLNYWPSFVVDESGYGGAVIAKEPSDKVILSAEEG